jgi:hypothetical protein
MALVNDELFLIKSLLIALCLLLLFWRYSFANFCSFFIYILHLLSIIIILWFYSTFLWSLQSIFVLLSMIVIWLHLFDDDVFSSLSIRVISILFYSCLAVLPYVFGTNWARVVRCLFYFSPVLLREIRCFVCALLCTVFSCQDHSFWLTAVHNLRTLGLLRRWLQFVCTLCSIYRHNYSTYSAFAKAFLENWKKNG